MQAGNVTTGRLGAGPTGAGARLLWPGSRLVRCRATGTRPAGRRAGRMCTMHDDDAGRRSRCRMARKRPVKRCWWRRTDVMDGAGCHDRVRGVGRQAACEHGAGRDADGERSFDFHGCGWLIRKVLLESLREAAGGHPSLGLQEKARREAEPDRDRGRVPDAAPAADREGGTLRGMCRPRGGVRVSSSCKCRRSWMDADSAHFIRSKLRWRICQSSTPASFARASVMSLASFAFFVGRFTL